METTITGFRLEEIKDETFRVCEDCKRSKDHEDPDKRIKVLFALNDLESNLVNIICYGCIVKLGDYIRICIDLFTKKQLKLNKEREQKEKES